MAAKETGNKFCIMRSGGEGWKQEGEQEANLSSKCDVQFGFSLPKENLYQPSKCNSFQIISKIQCLF